MNHLVSVIIPTFNREHFLSEAIQSVIAQTYRPIECIVVDDGSTDETKTLVEKLYSSTPESFTLKYIYQSNAGSQVARNTGTHASTGEFIQYLDSDDLLYPGKLEKQVDFLKTHPECDGVFGDWQVGIIEKNETITAYKQEDFIAQILTERCIANFSFLMKRDIVEKIGDWDVKIQRNQEIDFHLRGVLEGGKFNYFPGLCGLWRTHTGDRIGNKSSIDATIRFYNKWENILRDKRMWNELLQKGVAGNYIWLLNEKPVRSNHEIKNLLIEIKRLNPEHPIFKSKKFTLVQKLLGNETALHVWIKRFKRNMNHG